MTAAEILAAKSVKTGIILLEMLKPYDRTASLVANALPAGSCGVIFLEEEIRNGGMGMLLSDALSGFESMKNKNKNSCRRRQLCRP